MLKRLRERAGSESGFTLIELLVVMLILGILAAIAIPAFLNQKEKAGDSKVKVQARTAATAMETYATDNNGAYTGATGSILNSYEPTVPVGATPSYPGGSVAYRITMPVSSAGVTYVIERSTAGAISGTCSVSSGSLPKGGCPANGQWTN
jgi:type IV pilus assembly protein PilA